MIEVQAANSAETAYYEELKLVLMKHQLLLSPIELLAVTSVLLGNVIALQDKSRIYYVEMNEVVRYNSASGYQDATNNLSNVAGNA